MFHAVGITPEAPTLEEALGGNEDVPVVEVGLTELVVARDDLSTVPDGTLAAVALGTPHASARELRSLVEQLDGEAPTVPISVNTSRDVLEASGMAGTLAELGVDVVVDTCTYLKPIMAVEPGQVMMTDSAKWAYYAPANIGAEVIFGSTADCVASAVSGFVTRDAEWWGEPW